MTPLKRADTAALRDIGLDPRIWEWSTRAIDSAAGMEAYVSAALSERSAGRALPYVTRLTASGKYIGSTRFGSIDTEELRAEIGWTWLTPDHWRTGANVEAKLLMLTFAFETLGLRRVEFKTDERNTRSRTAIEALGATYEGTFRKHMVTAGGGVRNSAYYSVIDDEWETVKASLLERQARLR